MSSLEPVVAQPEFPSSALAASRRRTLSRLRATVVVAFALPVLVLLATAVWLYRQAFDEARSELDGASRIAQEHALKMLETNEMVLARMLDLLGNAPDAEVLARGADVHERLKQIAGGLPQVQGLFINGADGRSLGNSRVYPPPRQIDFSDREWYLAHRAGQGGGVFITEQIRSRITGEAAFDMSRRRAFADGTFAGSVNVSLRPEYLTAFWQEMAATAPGLHMQVVRADGRLLARWPDAVPDNARLPAGHPLVQRIAGTLPHGDFESGPAFDGARRVGVFHKLGQYPLYVAAAFDRADVIRGWASRVGQLALFVVPLACALAWMAWIALERTREELDAVQRLEEETARRSRTELALAQSQKLEVVGQLAGGVAHDFNNLLMIVANNLHLLRLRTAPGAEGQIAAIERAVGSGTRLTRQLLALSGRQALAPERVLLQERLPGLLALVRAALPASIGLEAHVAPDTAAIFVDVAELELALVNLALNARDAMEGGGQLVVSARNAGDQVVVEVTDTGRGIDPAIVERVLEPFFTTKPAGKGTGLGLTQVESVCRSAGGRVNIASHPGKGTRVQLHFPRAADDAGGGRKTSAARRSAELNCALLLVEDNDALAQATSEVLKSLGCRVRHAENAEAALKVAGEQAFDVVLSDVEMPGRMDGIELAVQLSQRTPPLPVVLMSGYAARIEQANSRGLEVLSKPCAPSMLREAIAAALAGRPKTIASAELRPAGASPG